MRHSVVLVCLRNVEATKVIGRFCLLCSWCACAEGLIREDVLGAALVVKQQRVVRKQKIKLDE
jgi:hypothetical protein